MFRRLPNTLALGLKWSLGRRSYGLVKTRLLPLLLVNFIGTIGFSLVLPFLVFLVTDWGGNAFVYGLNRTGFLGDLIAWEDGVYGTSKSVFSGGA